MRTVTTHTDAFTTADVILSFFTGITISLLLLQIYMMRHVGQLIVKHIDLDRKESTTRGTGRIYRGFPSSDGDPFGLRYLHRGRREQMRRDNRDRSVQGSSDAGSLDLSVISSYAGSRHRSVDSTYARSRRGSADSAVPRGRTRHSRAHRPGSDASLTAPKDQFSAGQLHYSSSQVRNAS